MGPSELITSVASDEGGAGHPLTERGAAGLVRRPIDSSCAAARRRPPPLSHLPTESGAALPPARSSSVGPRSMKASAPRRHSSRDLLVSAHPPDGTGGGVCTRQETDRRRGASSRETDERRRASLCGRPARPESDGIAAASAHADACLDACRSLATQAWEQTDLRHRVLVCMQLSSCAEIRRWRWRTRRSHAALPTGVPCPGRLARQDLRRSNGVSAALKPLGTAVDLSERAGDACRTC